jgi:hypothetical protein
MSLPKLVKLKFAHHITTKGAKNLQLLPNLCSPSILNDHFMPQLPYKIGFFLSFVTQPNSSPHQSKHDVMETPPFIMG